MDEIYSTIVKKMEKALKCMLCQKILTKPLLIEKCSHTVCRICFLNNSYLSCPKCKINISADEISPDEIYSNMLMNFENLRQHTNFPRLQPARPRPRSSSETDDFEVWMQCRRQFTEEMAVTVEQARQRRAEVENHYEVVQQWAKSFEKNYKLKTTDKTPENLQMPVSSLSALFDNNSSSSFGFGLENTSIGLGLRATMPRMLSFARNNIKAPSPPPLDDEDSNIKAGESGFEGGHFPGPNDGYYDLKLDSGKLYDDRLELKRTEKTLSDIDAYPRGIKHCEKDFEEPDCKHKRRECKENESKSSSRAREYDERLSIEEDISFPQAVEPECPELKETITLISEEAFKEGDPEDVMVDNLSQPLRRKDIHSLKGLQWINDNIINSYFDLIMERSKQKGYPSAHAFNTYFYSTLKKKGYASVRRWCRGIDIFSYDLNFVPLHLEVHWCLAVIDHRYKKIRYYDSLPNGEKRCLNYLHEYLILEHKDKKGQILDPSIYTTEIMKGVPKQKNGSDCGIFTLKYAEFISRDAEITFSQEHMADFRRRVVYELLNWRIL